MYNKLENKKKIFFLLAKIKHFLFSEKFKKKIVFNFDQTKNRLDLIQQSINKNNYKSYLEIGCDQNQIFNNIKINFKIGVDPISGGNFKGTSDDFFSQNQEYFDCIFIDGLHEYQQVKKDIKNSLKFLNKGGVIFLHDCLPNSVSKQYVPRSRYSWNGDVWKAVVEVRTWSDCDTCTCLIDQGISIIKKRKNMSTLNLDLKKFEKLKFKFFFYNYQNLMRIKKFDEAMKFL